MTTPDPRALGWTLAAAPLSPGLDHGRDLVFARGDDGRRRLALAVGADALAQDLTVALTTALGSDLFNTGFGFDGLRAIAEETRASLQRERIRVAVVQTVRQDPRVRRVAEVTVEQARDGARGRLVIALSVEVVGGAQTSFTFSMSAI